MGFSAAQNFFRVFGLVYAGVAVYGFVVGNGMLLNMVANNVADSILHTVVAVFALYMGFAYGRSSPPSRPGAYA